MRASIDPVAERTGLEPGQVALVLKTGFAAIAESPGRGGAVELRGFGTFEAVTERGRPGRDFGKGERIAAVPGRRVRFRAGSAVPRALKGEG